MFPVFCKRIFNRTRCREIFFITTTACGDYQRRNQKKTESKSIKTHFYPSKYRLKMLRKRGLSNGAPVSEIQP